MSLRAFVTGATGFVGSNLVRELLRQNWEVFVLLRPSSESEGFRDMPVHIRAGDVTDAASVRDAMPVRSDAVFHVAASTNVWSGHNDEQQRVNVDGTRNVIKAAVARQAGRLVHTSSIAVWGIQNALLTESSPRTSATDWINYVRTKNQAETLVKQAVQQRDLDAVILNPANILGPGDRRNWSRMIMMVDKGGLPGVPPGSGPFADVREVAKAHAAAYHRGKKGENYLLGGVDVSYLELIRLTGEILGKPVPSKASPGWLLKAAARINALIAGVTGREPDLTPESATIIIHHLRCDSSRAERGLGYRFTPIQTLLRDTIDWMRQADMLDQ
jgi:nucleoside-diphosphate-sugar epimerase